ncbi:MAG: hypothetical protein ACTTJO_00155 [Metamycoplasmataceae bacterium]|uniref:hypothetical protein n=1 Tax=Mycoplasmopsis lipophila TaxID=2117 RepID=UPI0038734D1D
MKENNDLEKEEKNSKIKKFFKHKIFTKTFAFFAFIIGLFAILISMISIKISNKFKPSFYGYQSYMSPENIKKINQKFDYKEFGEISEFTKAILTNKAVAGIGSDSQAVNLIKKNVLKKIDYEKIFGKGIKSPEAFLRKDIWEHMLSYDKYLTTDYWGNVYKDENGNPKPRHLWEYFLPYYSQDTIIAYNPSKLKKPAKDVNFKNVDANGTLPMIDILRTLKEEGYNSWAITNAIRDNLIYGSAYQANLEDDEKKDTEATGSVYPDTYEELIKNFIKLIQDGTSYSVNDDKHINFKSDGLELLNLLLNPNSKINAAIMYNGDGIDAFYSEDNFKNVKNGTIRYIKPRKNLLLVDGFVLANNKNKNIDNEVYEIARKTWMSNYTKIYQVAKDVYKDKSTEILNNPNSVEHLDKIKNIYKIAKEQILQEQKILQDNLNKTYPNEENRPSIYESNSNPGFQNFNYIGYTPTNRLEYEHIYENYFENEDKDFEQRAKKLYEITGKHISIKPISDDLLSELSVYYNKQIKG